MTNFFGEKDIGEVNGYEHLQPSFKKQKPVYLSLLVNVVSQKKIRLVNKFVNLGSLKSKSFHHRSVFFLSVFLGDCEILLWVSVVPVIGSRHSLERKTCRTVSGGVAQGPRTRHQHFSWSVSKNLWCPECEKENTV